MPQSSDRLRNLPPYVFAVIAKQIQAMSREGIDIIRLDIGNPDLPPPDHIINALSESAHNPNHHDYSGYTGIPRFREAIARYYRDRFGVALNPDTEVLPLIGSKEGIINLSLAYLDQGDVSLVPDIGYPAYAMGARLAHAAIAWMKLEADTNFLPDFSAIAPEDAEKAKLLWLNYPNNPTGATADLDFYQEAVKFCIEHDIILASDNPYCEVTYDNYRAPSVLQIPGAKAQTVEFISFSKTYNMAGWRLGAAVGSADALKNLLQVKSNIDSGHFKAIYDAGINAVDCTTDQWLEDRNRVYQRRRDKIMQALPKIGLAAEKPRATLYIWARVLEMDADEYTERARSEAHVSIAPGSAYGPGGNGYVRISTTVPEDRLDEAMSRLEDWYAKNH